MNALPLEPGEKVLYTARKHWFIFATAAFGAVILGLLPLALLFLPAELQQRIAATTHLTGTWVNLIYFLTSIWMLLLTVALARIWTDYYLDVWFVTNFRVMAIEQRGMFNRKISVFRFDQIQDVTVEVAGILGTLINFGTIRVQTASEDMFVMRGVAKPERLKERIMEQHHRVNIATP